MDSISNQNDKKQRNTRIAKYLTLFFTCLLLLNFIIITLLYSIADWVALLIFSLLFIVPAYLSNAGMVIVGKGKPVDGGKICRDGRRLLGDHKTWNGLIKGPLYIGIPISIVLFLIFTLLWDLIRIIPDAGITLGIYRLYNDIIYYQYYFIGGSLPIGFIVLLLRIFLCSYGAGFGDLLGSFLKRRFNIESGEPFWVIDSLDFAGIAIIITSIPSFFMPNIFLAPDIFIVTFLLILTPSVSIIANTIAYIIGLKDVPW
jgi:CDP-2,3-bis-(O-geranylgeranyl)-sn-glycerol synthase